MKVIMVNGKSLVLILTIVLITFGTQSSYGQTITASTPEPLTEATPGTPYKVTFTLSGGRFVGGWASIEDALSVSGIDEDIILLLGVQRANDTEVIVLLFLFDNIDADATLTFTVEAGAIVEYNGNALTGTLSATAVETTLEASTEALLTEVTLETSTEVPLTEATLPESVVTLTLSGSRFVGDEWVIQRGVSVSGIEGVTLGRGNVKRVSDTEVAVRLTFDGTDFDTDATLTFTVGADAIAGYNQDLTGEVSVTAIQNSNATVSISPASVVCPDVGKELTFSLNIEDGENVAGYRATVLYSYPLAYMRSVNGDFPPMDAFFTDQSFYREVRLAATTLAGASNGDGALATLTFEVKDFKPSTLTLSEVYLVDADGKRWEVATEGAEVTIPPEPENAILEDINRDGVVNIQDLVIVNVRFGQTGKDSADINGDGIVNIVDLVLVAGAFKNGAAAPALYSQPLERLTAADIQRWLSQARQLELTGATSLRGILFLQQLLAALIPEESALLSNYPNPFNPETWIPYRLSKPADVTLTIYAVDGQMVRRLSLGHQPAGIYQSRSRAAYWNGKNKFGEPVASGLYFYTLTGGGFTATRKMLIRK